MNITYLFIFTLLAVILHLNDATLSPSKKGKKVVKELKTKKGPQSTSVIDRNLIEEEPVARDILLEHATYFRDTDLKLFNGTVLGYVTPWNNHGYDVAKTWGPKFDAVSPVWLQIVRSPDGKYEVQGTHDIDEGWMRDVRAAGGHKNKFLPRILFDKFTDDDFSKLLSLQHEQQTAIRLIVDTCTRYAFDGFVLEIWSQLAARVDDHHLLRLVRSIANALRNANRDMILVVPPIRKEMYDLFSRHHFEELVPVVSGFSLMTYDFSSIQRPGANAPLNWMKEAVQHICPDGADDFTVKRAKILLGFNLYGNDFTPDGGGSIVGGEFVELLKHVKGRLRVDEGSVENFFEAKTPTGRHMVFYPTLYSISQRIQLARELGTGISLWELGQGLDYFYDLF